MGKGRLYSKRIGKFGTQTTSVKEMGTDWNPACSEDVMNPGFGMEKDERLKMSFQIISKLIHFSCWWGGQSKDG